MNKVSLLQKLSPIFLGIILLGCILRFIGITENRFIYFDEGMWLNHNRGFVELVKSHPPKNIFETGKVVGFFFRVGLETAKPLWSFISSLRVFFTGVEGWDFVRIVSAISGCLTVFMTFVFVRDFYKSIPLALLSSSLISILPSHMYYSQLGLQEAFSGFLFLAGIYCYLRTGKLKIIYLVLSSFCFACVFLSNYRMIVSPAFVLVTELYLSWARKESFNFQKFIWHTVAFLAFVIGVSAFSGGKSLYISFGWMFHQSNLAKGHFEWLNFLSYPYFVFNLETVLFGLLFFSSFIFVFHKEWLKFFPVVLVLLQMGLFSFSQEKAARFLCVIMPFMAIAAALMIDFVLEKIKDASGQKFFILIVAMMMAQQIFVDFKIVKYTSDYEASVQWIQSKIADAKMLSTQNEIQTLYVSNSKSVQKVPLDHAQLLEYARGGFQFLIIDPQSYISYTEDQKRFTPRLAGYLGFIEHAVRPVKEFSHFTPDLLKRFVFDHNDSLSQSIKFLKANENGELGKLKIYNISECISAINLLLIKSKNQT